MDVAGEKVGCTLGGVTQRKGEWQVIFDGARSYEGQRAVFLKGGLLYGVNHFDCDGLG